MYGLSQRLSGLRSRIFITTGTSRCSSHGVRRDGSAALDLASVAGGRFDGFWEFGLNPWDTAAGRREVGEAGGKITDLDGKPYVLGGTSILATNGLIHQEMTQVAEEIAKRGTPPL